MASRTSFIVALATLPARAEPASRISQASRGLSSYFLRRSCMGFKMLTRASAAQPLHSSVALKDQLKEMLGSTGDQASSSKAAFACTELPKKFPKGVVLGKDGKP